MQRNKLLSPSDVLCVILVEMDRWASVKNGGRKCVFRAHDYVFQRKFAKLQKEYDILNCFVFSDSGPEPYSTGLENAFTVLSVSGFLHRYDSGNPEPFAVSEATWEYYVHELLPLDRETGRQSKEIAERLLKKIPAITLESF